MNTQNKVTMNNGRYVAAGLSAILAATLGITTAMATPLDTSWKSATLPQVKALLVKDSGKVSGKTVTYSGKTVHVVAAAVLPGFLSRALKSMTSRTRPWISRRAPRWMSPSSTPTRDLVTVSTSPKRDRLMRLCQTSNPSSPVRDSVLFPRVGSSGIRTSPGIRQPALTTTCVRSPVMLQRACSARSL